MKRMVGRALSKWRRGAGSEAASSPGEVATRCAAMLRGGVVPVRVFGLLAEEAPDGAAERQIHEEVLAGVTPGAAIARAATARESDGDGDRNSTGSGGTEWKLFAAAWQLAEETGAPLAAALERIAAALQTLRRLQERRDVLLSGPRATTRLVAVLPPLVLVLGWLLGFDPSPVLLSAAGISMVSLGVLLLLIGVRWAQRLTQRIQAADRVAGIELELVWVALGGGSAPRDAVRRVVDTIDQLGIDWVPYDRFCSDGALERSLQRAASVGMPLGPLLLAEAASLRESSHAELEVAAERLGVRVLIPLGVCVLPSFIVMGVLPVVISMLSGSAY